VAEAFTGLLSWLVGLDTRSVVGRALPRSVVRHAELLMQVG
jgi:hypothetical protein